jgi:hypothetical protein
MVIKPVHMRFSYIYHVYELTMFIGKSKKFTYILSIVLYLCIKFLLELLDLAYKNSQIISNKYQRLIHTWWETTL